MRTTTTGADVATRAFTRVIEMAEPLTRYDGTSLVLMSALSRTASGHATWSYSASLSDRAESSTGRLPYCEHVASDGELDAAATRAMADGYAALPHRLNAWKARNDENDSKLSASDCFDGPKVFGYEQKHAMCEGNGWVVCPGCKRGYNSCDPCKSIGHIPCTHCKPWFFGELRGPQGTERCRRCSGAGKDSQGVVCGNCNRTGRVPCMKCKGALKITCSSCAGAGRLAHDRCRATGQLACEPCKGTGYHHWLRRIECAVADRFHCQVADTNREVADQLSGRNLQGLRMVAMVMRRPTIVDATSLIRHFDVDCAVGEIVIAVPNQQLSLVSYGDEAHIENYKDIVKHLLEPDRVDLRRAVAASRFRLWGDPEPPLAATRRFLESEVNMTLDNPHHVKIRVIDAAYVTEASTLLRSALCTILASQMGAALLATALVPAACLLIVHAFNWWALLGDWIALLLIVAAVMPFTIGEWRARTTLIRGFDAVGTTKVKNLGAKIDGLLGKYRATWKLRAIGATAAAVAVIATGILISSL